ncbi:MAG: sugar transferase [Nitrospinota bacterium]|jgi:lipopolysaccharide/colanic/teichoic acid biosynthesis glycosyltransferase|nr:sugar transferase [Nitrospinota bacterium]
MKNPRAVVVKSVSNRNLFLKRSFDVFLSGLGVLFSLPIWGLVALGIKLEDRGPVFYFQKRVGIKGKTFMVWKFRSMVPDAEMDLGPVQAVEEDPRTTRIGRYLRRTALDELPQLINIFLGDMSFVGPRALRPEEMEVDKPGTVAEIWEFSGGAERQSVVPGLTGIAQIYGNHDTPRRFKFRYDLLYIKNQSVWLDMKLIFLSFLISFRGNWESRERKFGGRLR